MACQIETVDFLLIFIAGGSLGITLGYIFRMLDEPAAP